MHSVTVTMVYIVNKLVKAEREEEHLFDQIA
jgi:hypothetical protein